MGGSYVFFLLLMFLGPKQRYEFNSTLFTPVSQGKEDRRGWQCVCGCNIVWIKA